MVGYWTVAHTQTHTHTHRHTHTLICTTVNISEFFWNQILLLVTEHCKSRKNDPEHKYNTKQNHHTFFFFFFFLMNGCGRNKKSRHIYAFFTVTGNMNTVYPAWLPLLMRNMYILQVTGEQTHWPCTHMTSPECHCYVHHVWQLAITGNTLSLVTHTSCDW